MPAHAAQGLSLGTDVNNVDECGVAIPVATLKQQFRDALWAAVPVPGSSCVDVWTQFPEGSDHTTSEDDTLELHGLVWGADQIFGIPCTMVEGDVRVKIWLVPGDTAEGHDLSWWWNERYHCKDPDTNEYLPAPEHGPTVFVRRIYYYRLDNALAHCAGDDCPTTGEYRRQDAEHKRCELQGLLQQAAAALTNPLQEQGAYLAAIDPGLVATDPADILHSGRTSDEKYRTTITETGGEPHLLVWRIPDVMIPDAFGGGSLVDQVRSSLLANADLAEQYGVFLTCYRGQGCAHDADDDGWCDDEDCCPNRFNLTNSHTCLDSDGDGIPDDCDNCPNDPNADQADLDNDLQGDECDNDKDGDGVLKDFDFDDFNPELQTDIDRDDVCDKSLWGPTANDWNVHAYACVDGCNHAYHNKVDANPGTTGIELSWRLYRHNCFRRCFQASDNCVDGHVSSSGDRITVSFDSDACHSVYLALTGGNAPAAADLAACQDLYANPRVPQGDPSLGYLQPDSDGDGVGDRCETGVQGLIFRADDVVYDSDSGIQSCGVDTYTVSFHANSASVTETEVFGDTSVESCACTDPGAGVGGWPAGCLSPSGTCDLNARDKWNPIHDSVFQDTSDTASFPISPDLEGTPQSHFIGIFSMGRDRKFSFERSYTANERTFQWEWASTVRYPQPFDQSQVGLADLKTTQGHELPLKVRVAHSHTLVDDSHRFGDEQVTLSAEVYEFKAHSFCEPQFTLPRLWNQFLWLDPGPYKVARPGLFTDPLHSGWGVAEQPGVAPVLVTFGHTLAQPATIKTVEVLAGTDTVLDLSGLRTTTAKVAYPLVGGAQTVGPAVFAYGIQTSQLMAAQASASTTPVGTPVLWIGLLDGEASQWMTADQLFSTGDATTTTPPLADGAPVFDETSQRLFVLGHEWTSGGETTGPVLVHNVLQSLDLATGQWTRWGQIAALGDAEGASVTFDPLKRRLLVYGGHVGETTLSRLVEIRLDTLDARVLSDCATGEACGGRTDHGATYDPISQVLYVYGGTRNGEPLADGQAFDLLAGTWSDLPGGGAEGPGPRTRPIVSYDARQGALWVAGGLAGESTVEPWQLSLATGAWIKRASLTMSTSDRTVAPYEPLTFLGQVDDAAAYPGQLRLIEADSTEPNLQLQVTDEPGRLLGQDAEPAFTHQVILLGQPGQGYLAKVSTGPGFPDSQPVSVSFHDREATLEQVGFVAHLPDVTSVAAGNGMAYVGHGLRVAVVDLSNPAHPAVLADVNTGGLVQEVARCGEDRLCVAQTWSMHSLVVLDVHNPHAPTVTASLSLPGVCRSLAVQNGLAYVGCGAAGVHAVALDAVGGPVRADTLWLGGPVSDVEATRGLLTVGLFGKRVKVYAIGGATGPAPVADYQTAQHPVHLQVLGNVIQVSEAKGLDWALCAAGLRCGPGQQVEVLDLDEPAGTLDLVGSYAGSLRTMPFTSFWRDLAVVPEVNGIDVLRAEALP